jgi:hypothetical protein
MTKSSVTVNNPCSQKWDSINPYGEGRFCESCNKTVIDFTKMKNEEIISYLKNQPGKTCGYFLPHQVEVKRPKFHQFLMNRYEKNQNGIKPRFFRNVTLAFIAFCMTLVGCNSPKTTGEINMPSDTLENEVPLTYDSSKMDQGNNIIGDTTAVYKKK